ncbi:heme peroxidase [Dactylonectria macrodidyma]|uniref:Peroxidase n=1 Tax=Dactylonectria macrodidyma TaxID=307937 RepID=A0A9P9DC86_9HYPO|nr:heme peroxidase [Dactylonectria macrodidyma]
MSIIMKHIVTAALILGPLASGQLVWPSKWDELEDIYTMQAGYHRQGFSDSVNPCTFGGSVQGRQNSAEWIRTAFHDMAAHDATAGTGGIDASIFFELQRGENAGSAFNNTFAFFYGYHSVRASASDLIALGVVTASSACRGPKVEFRAGRIDANKAGAAGVPEPSTSLAKTTVTFRKAGFSKQDMIAMVACGHTLGGVHSADFPEIVKIPADPNNDTNVPFQKDVSNINNGVVTEFLQGTTKNPLVVASNNTLNSDKRIFNADRNFMKKLANKETFQATCGSIFTRMIDTVPKNVKLTDIAPYDVKPYVDELSVNKNGDMSFKGRVRLRTTKGAGRNADDLAVKLVYADNKGKGQTVITAKRATFQSGSTTGLNGEQFVSFEFDATIKAKSGISKFWIQETVPSTKKTKTHDNQGSGGYPVQDTVLLQLPESCLNTDAVVNNQVPLSITAMVREEQASNPLTLKVVHKVPRKGVIVPQLKTELVQFKATRKKKNGWVAYRAQTKVTDFTTYDIVLGGKTRKVVDFKKTVELPSSCPR